MIHWMRGVVIQPDGAISVEQVQADLEGLQALVGGYIEAVGLKCPAPATAYINEEGKIHDLPRNPLATSVAHLFPGDYIAGTMVILGAPDGEGYDTSVSDEVLSWLGLPLGGEVAPEDADDFDPFTVGAVLRHKERTR
jgi:hypothetical protein